MDHLMIGNKEVGETPFDAVDNTGNWNIFTFYPKFTTR